MIEKHKLLGSLRPPKGPVRYRKWSEITYHIRPLREDAASNEKNPAALGKRKVCKLFHFVGKITRDRSKSPMWFGPTGQS